MSDALKLEGVRAGYGETVVLEDVSFSLAQRGSLAVLGRNGVGKTTLLATIMGHTTFHGGSIRYENDAIDGLPAYARNRRGIGYVPQAREIFPSLTVQENLMVAERPGPWTLERVYDLLPRLAERRHHRGNQISGGEQQMLAIARALMGNPSLLLLDEPLEGLAPLIVQYLLGVMQRLIRDESLTVILVEQSARLALEVTESVLILNRGRIVHSGASAELCRRSRAPHRAGDEPVAPSALQQRRSQLQQQRDALVRHARQRTLRRSGNGHDAAQGRLDDRPRDQLRVAAGLDQRVARQHRVAVAALHEIHDGADAVHFECDGGLESQCRKARVDQHADGVRPARDDQRVFGQAAQFDGLAAVAALVRRRPDEAELLLGERPQFDR